jgi:hypothetical protein
LIERRLIKVMFDTLRDNAGALIALLFIIDVILIAAVIVLYRQSSLLRRNISILKRGADGETLLQKAATHTAAIEDLYRRIDEQVAQKDYLTEVLAGTVQRIAMIRFDAFEDMGGKLSYTIAMLDENGDGLVLTSIYGRNENRTYAKTVQRGTSAHVLSREENEAVNRALSVKPPLIRSRKGGPPKPFDIKAAEGDSDTSQREDDGSWVM